MHSLFAHLQSFFEIRILNSSVQMSKDLADKLTNELIQDITYVRSAIRRKWDTTIPDAPDKHLYFKGTCHAPHYYSVDGDWAMLRDNMVRNYITAMLKFC